MNINPTLNNTINNNITINCPNIIYPYGYENISFVSNTEMLDILKCSNSLVSLFKKVYSHLENKNFNKRNMNNDSITYFNHNYDVEVSNEKDFNDIIVKMN